MKRRPVYKILTFILLSVVIIETVLLIHLWINRTVSRKAAKIPAVTKSRIAIVIDDWGYNQDNLNILNEIKYPFTASVLPRLDYSKEVAKELHENGVQVMLHLPMEPRESSRLEKNTILVSMSEQEIKGIIGKDLADIQYAVGVSNHMGSKATEDPKTMGIVFKELKKRNLFFLDSVVSSKTICSGLAEKSGLGFIKRDVFIDNNEDPGYIKEQFYKLKRKALLRGYAVGVGHDRRNTLEVMKEIMPQIEKEGYEFVFISEMVK
ncbi:MAG: divergent polysaccharide deacetylase family protein [Candidatus Omnitrophota bacterium]